ncbi:MAG TPA: adenosylcobinamide-GDP ribazoletransferase [Actinomycetales bacterium]|nr:adenosylcobinamide-GDP ribazoletransferase [Actinomycetales bacterium]
MPVLVPAESAALDVSGTWADAVRLAVGTLTVVPVAPPRAVTPRVAGRAMLLAPVAALPLALLTTAVLLASDLARLPSLPGAALAVGVLALATRGLHLDGLADTADGLASGYDRERALSVMRSGDVGPAGVAATVLVLLVQVGCLTALLETAGGTAPAPAAVVARDRWPGVVAAVVLAVLLSRCVLPLACARRVPSARPSGLGATVAGSVPPAAAAVPLVVVAGLGALVLGWADAGWWRAPAAALAALVVTVVLVVRCTRRLGGITGDVLGACVELSFAATLLALAAG